MGSLLMASEVNITPEIDSIVIEQKNKTIKIERIQDDKHRLNNNFSKTSRSCPPFCIQPMNIANVKTVGELEVLAFLKNLNEQSHSILIDARTSEWYRSGSIPGAINLPFTMLKKDGKYINKILYILGANKKSSSWDFSNVQQLMIFSNGIWDKQASEAIKSLLEVGYPSENILYYRGGMQSWCNVGLTTI